MTTQFKNNLKNKLADTEFKVVNANNRDTFIWIGTKDGTIGNSQCHYEICFDSTGIHQKDKAYVEIHFEDSNRAFFNENVVIPLSENPNILRFKWKKGCDGLRINDNGYDFKTTDCTDAIVAELMELDRQAGNTIRNAINKFHKQQLNKTNMEKYVKLLKNCHNLVLTGAPGTGKTYLAQKIAAALGATKENGRCKMVQFHPSYDYTDFVEGLRPNESNFERTNGVFKQFCADALSNVNINDFDKSFDKLYRNLVEQQEEQQDFTRLIKIKTKTGAEFAISANSKGNLNLHTGSNFEKQGTLTREKIRNQIDGHNVYWKGYYQGVVDLLKNKYELKVCDESVKFAPMVFIIDEINRGELSKIFGELFFSIDPGYRGEKGRVATQYQNLIEEGDVFKSGFYVPKNVYIIGTMNDIDRSVESMDFAIRRRFAWCEVKADKQTKMLEVLDADKDTAVNKMTALNETIDGIEGLNSAYHIGPAYFLKLKQYENDENKWESLWEYNLKGVLSEYLRGREDATKKLEDLKEAYYTGKSKKEAEKGNNE